MEQLNENQLKVKRAETVMQIGEFYYKKFREQSATPDAEIENLVNMVADWDLQIARVTGAWMEQQGVCPNCGEYHSKYSGNYGSSVSRVVCE